MPINNSLSFSLSLLMFLICICWRPYAGSGVNPSMYDYPPRQQPSPPQQQQQQQQQRQQQAPPPPPPPSFPSQYGNNPLNNQQNNQQNSQQNQQNSIDTNNRYNDDSQIMGTPNNRNNRNGDGVEGDVSGSGTFEESPMVIDNDNDGDAIRMGFGMGMGMGGNSQSPPPPPISATVEGGMYNTYPPPPPPSFPPQQPPQQQQQQQQYSQAQHSQVLVSVSPSDQFMQIQSEPQVLTCIRECNTYYTIIYDAT